MTTGHRTRRSALTRPWRCGGTCAVLVLLAVLPCRAASSIDWSQVEIISHADYQSINADGSSTYGSPVPFRLRGVVLNNSEDWLDPTESYNEIPWNLGGEAEVFVQAVDLDGTPWDPDPASAFDDFGGTAAWIGQCYGNLGFIGDEGMSHIDEDMTPDVWDRPVWYDELDRLGFYHPGTPLSTDAVVRPGDLIEIRARKNGLNYQGKHNVNEQHNNDPSYDYELVILQKGFGLPEAAAIPLAAIKDANDSDIFDPTRETGGEQYQAARVELQRVRFAPGSSWGTDEEPTLVDDTGRTLPVYLGLNESFDASSAPWGYFDVTGILDQASPDHIGGYRLLAMSAADFAAMEGDTDKDWDVDNTDLGAALGNWTGPGAFGSVWADGDSDGDGDVDNTDLGQAFGNFTGPVTPPELPLELAAPVPAGLAPPPVDLFDRADLLYDPASGEVWLDQTEAAGGVITNFVLGDAEGGFNTNVADFPFLGNYWTDLPTEISQTDPLGTGLPQDVWNLGAILPAGMSQLQLEALLDQATYVGDHGSGMWNLDLVAVPEPGTWALLLLGVVSMGLYRRLCGRRGLG